MSVFREITLTWGGESHTVQPSLALLRRIKSKGINNAQLAHACFHGGADLEDLAIVHSEFMSAAGVPVSEEESYAFLTSNRPEVTDFQIAYVQTVIPSVDLGKKPEAPARKPRSEARAKKSKI